MPPRRLHPLPNPLSAIGNRHSSYDLARLRAGITPLKLRWYPRLGSTSDHAIKLRRAGTLFAPALVLTGHQLAGRGRGTNTWWSGPGSITATFVFPIDQAAEPHQLPLLAGLTVRNALATAASADLSLKWPNDLVFNGKKLAGLLCERVDHADLIGLGLNVNLANRDVPRQLRDRVTSLSEIAGRRFDLTEVLAAVAKALSAALAHRRDRAFAEVLKEYDRHHALVGRAVTVMTQEGPLTGRCPGLDAMGRLLLNNGAAVHRVIAGQVVQW